MMEHQLLTDTNPVPASKKPRMNSDSDFGFIDLPEELTEIPFLTSSDNNSILDQPLTSAHQLDISVPQSSNVATPPNMGTPTNNMTTPSNMVTPPINNINSNTGTPSPSNMGGLPSQLGSATPPPNAVVSTSADPTPTLPSISSSPSHSFPPSSSLPPANATMTNSPYQMNMYQQRPHPGMHPQGSMGAGPMHSNSYGMPRGPYHHAGMPRMMGYNNPHMMSPHQPMLQSGGMGGMGGMDHGYPGQPAHPQMMQPTMGGMYQHHAPPPPPPTHKIDIQQRLPQPHQQQMPQLPPVMGGGQPSSASNDPEKRKLIQQQLVLLLHAHRCQQREREQQAHGGFRPCALPHCRTMKNVLNHMTECQAGRDCQFPHCASSRQIIYHWKNCNQQECPVCLPLKNTTRPNVAGSIGGVPNSMFGSEVPPASLPPYLVPTGMNSYPGQTVPHSAPPTGGVAPNQQIMKDTIGTMAPGQNPSLSQTAGQPQGGGVKPNPMGPAGAPASSTSGPMVPNQSMPPNQAWHAEVNSDLRNHLIKKIVEAIYPVPNPNSVYDSRVKSIFQYAVKVENMMFENASNREDYYQKLADKIYGIRKELDEKRRMNERRKMCLGIVDKWLKEGSVELTVTRVNMHGPPGAGKTCAQHLLLNEDPPTDRVTDSTPIARPTVRATRVSVDNLKWEKVTRAGLLERLASDLNVAAASQPEEHTETTSPLHVHAPQPEQRNDPIINFPSIANSAPPVIDSASPITNDASSIASSNPVIINPAPSISSDSIEAKESSVSNNEASSVSNQANNDETETVIQEIVDTIQRSAVQLSGHWLYIIDSGGQPAYQELLPLFIRTASLNIITLDLSQPLDKKLDFQYRIGGETFLCGLNLKYSNREFFQSAVSSGAILKPIDVPHVLETPSHPMHFVLGTHYDCISQESLKKIDEELMSSLKPDIKNYVVHNKRRESIIFPVNTLIPADKGRMEAGQKLCQSIVNCGGTSLKMHMPIRWFAFELWLQKVAEKKSRNVLVIDEVISAGKRFKMSEKDTKDALQYLHRVTIVLYFHDILPQLVFIDPQPILEILSRLLALTYVERNALHLITNPVPLDEDINKLHDIGFFQEKLLYHLKSDVELFFPPHFEPSHLIKLLIHLRVITIGKDGDYFFPYALQAYTNLSVPQTETKPLLIIWQDKYGVNSISVPQGMFPLLITHLLNQKEQSCSIEFPPLKPQYYKYCNALSLWIKIKGKRYTLHIINRYAHIEVYYDGSAKEAKVNCPYIREVVMTAVNQSADAINVKHNHINAFYCPKEKNCYCVVEEDYLVINCTLCTRSADISEDDESYWCWFGLTDCGLTECTPEALIPVLQCPLAVDICDLDQILTDMKEGHFRNCSWYDLGLKLGLYDTTLSDIESSSSEVEVCLRKCIATWLQRADGVDDKGRSSRTTLVESLEQCDKTSTAEHIRCKRLRGAADLLQIDADLKEGRLSVQFDYLIPQTDSLDSSVLIAGQKLFILQGDRSHTLQWEKYGFRLQCPQGAVSKDTEVAITALAGGNFKVPKGTMLVSAVYAISVSKPLLKPLVIELQHCVDLRYEGQTRCLKFVSGPLKHPYQLSPVEGGGSFSVGNRFGSIKRDTFSFNAIVAEMSDGDTDSDGGTPSEGSDDEDTDSSKEVMEMDEGPPVDVGTENGATESENIIKFRKRKGSESIVDDLPLKKTLVGQNNVQSVSSTNEQGSLSKPISKSSAAPSSSDSNRLILQSEVGIQVNSENNVTHSAVLYTGMMYYEEKEVGHWIAIYSVVRDLDVLIQYCNINHPTAEKDFVVDVFKFIESNGSIQLILSTTEHEGWKVHANREQMKLLQSTIDMFSSNPLYSSFSMDVHAKVGVTQDPLHYPIKIIGIDPEKTIYINRPPPTYKISPTSTASISQTRRETEEGVTYDSEKASKVITENALLIKGCGINLHFLVDKLLEHEIINAREKGEITDGYTGQTANERMDELLHIISSSINMDGKVFGIFLNILRKEGTIRTNTLADKLMGKYNLHKTE